MKRFMFLMVFPFVFAFTMNVSAEGSEGFIVANQDVSDGYTEAIAHIDQTIMSSENEKSDKHQMSYAQVNCDRCYVGGFESEIVINSMDDNYSSGEFITMRLPHYRIQF